MPEEKSRQGAAGAGRRARSSRSTSSTRNQHFTQPPPRYTEATLIKALEENGIGRPSTYAPTITTIIQPRTTSSARARAWFPPSWAR